MIQLPALADIVQHIELTNTHTATHVERGQGLSANPVSAQGQGDFKKKIVVLS